MSTQQNNLCFLLRISQVQRAKKLNNESVSSSPVNDQTLIPWRVVRGGGRSCFAGSHSQTAAAAPFLALFPDIHHYYPLPRFTQLI